MTMRKRNPFELEGSFAEESDDSFSAEDGEILERFLSNKEPEFLPKRQTPRSSSGRISAHSSG